MTEIEAIENAAVRACRDGGAYLRDAFRADERAGELFADEAGVASRSWDGCYVATGDESSLPELCETVESVV